ncbi:MULTISPECIES: hypothetical protein [Aerosakkonema]|uniref:hypothetical protein n=1 Tax=Aerosakkonema TaxID=1246629 RepID=UPI0035B827C2
MRKFFLLGLALALVLGGEMAKSDESLFTWPENEIVERVVNMTSGESFNSNAVVVDGVSFETLVPQLVLTVPNSQQETKINVEFGIRITNNTPTPFRFSSYRKLTPELVGSDERPIQLTFLRRRRLAPKESDFPLATPGESVTFFPNARLVWNRSEQLKLSIANGCGGYWSFQVTNPGIYKIRFIYKNENMEQTIHDKEEKLTNRKLIQGLWTGEVFTPFVKFRLI